MFIVADLNSLSYDLSDTQRVRCERCDLYTSSPCDKNSGERFSAHGPSCFSNKEMHLPENTIFDLILTLGSRSHEILPNPSTFCDLCTGS